jgi:hypothetical protein
MQICAQLRNSAPPVLNGIEQTVLALVQLRLDNLDRFERGVAGSATAQPSPARANLLTNGDFENGLQGWTDSTVLSIVQTYNPVSCGNDLVCQAAVINLRTNALASASSNGQLWTNSSTDPYQGLSSALCPGGCNSLSQSIATTVGTTYELSFAIRGLVTASSPLGAFGYNTQDWTFYTFELVAPTFTTVLQFNASSGGEVDSVSFDVAAVPEPSTWAMMILGFAGIGFMAYRRKLKPALMAA